jgi:hypothetical protein
MGLKTDKDFQLNFTKTLTDQECEDYYNAIMASEDKWVVDSPLGKQLASWSLRESKKGYTTKKFNTQFVPFKSPIDGTEISCNRGLRQHERKHGVRQVGTDLKPMEKKDDR